MKISKLINYSINCVKVVKKGILGTGVLFFGATSCCHSALKCMFVPSAHTTSASWLEGT